MAVIEKSGSKTKQWLCCLTANTVCLTYGMQSGWMSPAIPVLQGPNSPAGYPLSDMEISLIASGISFVAIFSSLVYSWMADRLGRKLSLIAIAVPQVMAWIIKLISANTIALIISQGLCGVAGGGVFSIAPIYTKEISEDSIRGAMGAVGMLTQSIGILIMYALGAYLSYYTVLAIAVCVPIVNTIFLLMVPESPAYLVNNKKTEEAKVEVAYLRGYKKDDPRVAEAVTQICRDQTQFDNLPDMTIKHVYAEKASRRSFLLGLLMITIVDISGNFAVLAYASVILNRSGVTIGPEIQALSLPAVMIVGSLMSSVTIEKFGRKPLIVTFLLVNGIPMIILATILLLQIQNYNVPAWIAVLCVVCCVFAYGAGILPVPYVVMSEIFSFQMRAKVMGIYVTYGWFCAFLQVITFSPVSQYLGMYTMFYIYGALNLINAIVTILIMPETKGKSLEEIQKLLCKRK